MAIGSEEITQKLPTNSLDYYLAILDSKENRLPKINEMPDKIFLPPEITDKLWAAWTESKRTGKEVSVSLNAQHGVIKHRYRVCTEDGVMPNVFYKIFTRKLADAHTHLLPLLPHFSYPDMAVFFSNPNLGYLCLTISDTGIAALARTQETAKTPFSSLAKQTKEVNFLRWGPNHNHKHDTNLTERGYIYYEWRNNIGDVSGQNTPNLLDFNQIKSGVELIRKEN